MAEVGQTKQRMENGITIHVHQVCEVTRNGGTDRVGRVVVKGHCVHEGLERAVSHLHEGIVNRVLLASAQRRVLQDVAHSRIVRAWRTEGDTVNQKGDGLLPEGVVRIGRVEVNVVRLRSQMLELKGGKTQFRNGTNTRALKAVNDISNTIGHFLPVYAPLCDGLISA